jgi:PAS domain S-box-containing protein
VRNPDRELAAQLVSERFLPLVAHLVLFTLLAVLVWSSVPRGLILGWGGLIVAVSLGRLIAWDWARRHLDATRTIRRLARGIMLVLGLTWGLGAAFIIRLLQPSDAGLVLLGLTGLLAGGLATLTADRWTYPIYAVAMFAPLAVVVGMVGPDLFDELGVVLILIYLVFTVRLQQRSHESLRRQMRVENELRDRERQLAAAQSIAHVGSWEWHLATDVVTWSDELRRMFGVTADAPAGYDEFLAIAHLDDRARLGVLVADCLQHQQPIDFEWRVVRPDGTIRDVQSRNVVVPGADGQPVVMAGTCFDVTEHKRVAQALAASEQYYRALIEQSLDLTTLVDADGFARYASPSYTSVLGYQPADIVGRRVFDLIHPDDLASTLAIFTEGRDTPGATRQHEFRFLHHDGSWRILAAVGRNLFDDPIIHAAIINARDVTEQKRTEAELGRAAAEVKTLEGILPICASCKRIRDGDGKWEAVESYVRDHSHAEFSHGLCPDCAARDWGTAPAARSS